MQIGWEQCLLQIPMIYLYMILRPNRFPFQRPKGTRWCPCCPPDLGRSWTQWMSCAHGKVILVRQTLAKLTWNGHESDSGRDFCAVGLINIDTQTGIIDYTGITDYQNDVNEIGVKN